MKSNATSKATDKIIVMFNLLTVRVDAFLSNFIEFMFIALYILVIYRYIRLLFLPAIEIMQKITFASLGSHILYSSVYVVNDFIDYQDVKRYKNDPLLYSFYKYRPIIYFDRSKSIIAYLTCLYLLCLFGILRTFPYSYNSYSLVILVTLLFIQSIVHSLCKGSTKVISFLLLRLMKYMLFLTMLCVLIDFFDKILMVIAALPLIIPYIAFVSLSYAEQKNLLKYKVDSGDGLKYLLLIFLASLIIYALYLLIILNYSVFCIINSIIFGYLMVVIPFLGIRMVLRHLFGPKNIDFHDHIRRLLAGALLTAAIVVCEIIVLFEI